MSAAFSYGQAIVQAPSRANVSTVVCKTSSPARLPWPENAVEELRKLWAEGIAIAEIAKRLPIPATVSSVANKAIRIGLKRRMPMQPVRLPTSNKPKKRSVGFDGRRESANAGRLRNALANKAAREVAAACVDEFGVIAPGARLLTLDERKSYGQCKWPHGDPRSAEFRYCAADATGSASYCDFHRALAYEPKGSAA